MTKKKLFIIPMVLLLCLALLVSATFAWLSMSRAPEISGIDTQIGANGNLEIALLNDNTYKDPNSIIAGVGSSAAATTVQQSNITWGNVVDLSAESYGLNKISLVPSRLNVKVGEDDMNVVNGNLLTIPTYGVDGRLQNFYSDTISATYKGYDFTYMPSQHGYGVRGIGSIAEISPQQSAITSARSLVRAYETAAANALESVWTIYGQGLFEMAYDGACGSYIDGGYVAILSNAANRTLNALGYLDSALRQSAIGYAATKVEGYSQFKELKSDLENGLIPLSQTLEGSSFYPEMLLTSAKFVENQKAIMREIQDDCYEYSWQYGLHTWDSIRPIYNKLIYTDYTYFNEEKLTELSSDTYFYADNALTFTSDSGVFYGMSKLLGEYSYNVSYSSDTLIEVRTLSEEKTDYLNDFASHIENTKACGYYTLDSVALDQVYGYAVDIAFRTNANSNLQLQTYPKMIVDAGGEGGTQVQGNGSYMSFSSNHLNESQVLMMMNAVRVGFLDNRNVLVGIAKLDMSDYSSMDDGYYAPLHMYEYALSSDGSLSMGSLRGDNIMPLDKGIPTVLTAVVWLDGDHTDNSIASTMNYSLSGKLNLQFSSDATLKPADGGPTDNSSGGVDEAPEVIVKPTRPVDTLKYRLTENADSSFTLYTYDEGSYSGWIDFEGNIDRNNDVITILEITDISDFIIAIPSVVGNTTDGEEYSIAIYGRNFLLENVVSKVTELSFFSAGANKIAVTSGKLDFLAYECSNLNYVDLSGLDISGVTTMKSMFSDCKNLRGVEMEGIDTSNVTNMSDMFSNCYALSSLDVSDLNTSKVTDMSNMFYGCSSLKNLDSIGFDTSKVTDMRGMFLGCYELSNPDVSKFNTANVVDMSYMFESCSNITSVDMSAWDFSKVEDMSYMFANSGINVFDMPSLQLPNAINMSSMFDNCDELTYVNLSKLYAPKAQDMSGMFYNWCSYDDYYEDYEYYDYYHSDCGKLESVIFANADISGVTNIENMFDGCHRLDSANFAGANMSGVVDMSNMFYDCKLLTKANFSRVNASSATSTSNMFYRCYMLAEADFSNFVASNLTDVYHMFEDCRRLIKADFSNFSAHNLTSTSYMFANDSHYGNLTAIFSNVNMPNLQSTAHMFNNSDNLSSVIMSGDTVSLTNMNCMFYDCNNLTSVDLRGLNTSNVTDMSGMFIFSTRLETLDLSYFDTSSVTNMSEMFNGCSNLTTLDISNFNTANVTDMSHLFCECKKLKSIDLNDLNTSNVTDMSSMFYSCEKLDSLELALLDTSKVTDMSYMLGYCNNFDLNGFNTSNVTDMSGLFYNCSDVTEIDLSLIDTSNVTDMSYMFYGCSSLTSLDLSAFDTSKVTDMSAMFAYCTGFSSLKLGELNTANVTNMSQMLRSCRNFDITGFSTPNVTNMVYMFAGDTGSATLDLTGLDTSKVTDMSYMFYQNTAVTSIDVSKLNTSKVTDMSYMFYGCSNLTGINLNSFDTAKVKYMSYMFLDCTALKTLDLSTFNTASVTNMTSMFSGCTSLTSLNLSNINTSNVTIMSYMFNNCSSLKTLDVSGFDTSKVTNMAYMFHNCSALTELDVSKFNTSRVTGRTYNYSDYTSTGMAHMFSGCSSLKTLDVSGFDTSNVSTIYAMFRGCTSLEELDVSGWRWKYSNSYIYMNYAFCDCSSLKKLDVSGWVYNYASTTGMYQGCSAEIITEPAVPEVPAQ